MRPISASDMYYARLLDEIGVEYDVVRQTRFIYEDYPELKRVFGDPTISGEVKYRIIDKIFDKSICNFLKVVVNNNMSDELVNICSQFRRVYYHSTGTLVADLETATEFTNEQIEEIKSFTAKKFGFKNMRVEPKINPDLIGGFVLRVFDYEFDYSVRGRINKLKNSIIK